jgi:transcription elongation factor GreA
VAKEYKITSARLEELKEELKHLKTTREKEVIEQIKEARSFGDLSENSEYDEARSEQAKLYGRIAEVEAILDNAVIIEENDEPADHVGLGCKVRVLDMEMDEEEEYTIVGSQEADPLNYRISDDSPFGRAMTGKTVGDVVEVEAPVGVLKFRILAVEK